MLNRTKMAQAASFIAADPRGVNMSRAELLDDSCETDCAGGHIASMMVDEYKVSEFAKSKVGFCTCAMALTGNIQVCTHPGSTIAFAADWISDHTETQDAPDLNALFFPVGWKNAYKTIDPKVQQERLVGVLEGKYEMEPDWLYHPKPVKAVELETAS